MGVDAMIGLECTAKQVLTPEGIVARLKARSRAQTVLRMLRDRGDERPPEELTFTTVLMRPAGPVETQVSVQSLFDEAKALDAHAPQCMTCPARTSGDAFGCYRYLNYPVLPETEAWLMSRLPDDLKSPGGFLLESAVRDFGWDGSYGAQLRAQGETFFVARQPIVRKWGGFFSRFKLSSDQLWHMLFGLGPLQPAHMEMLCIFLGYPDHQVPLSRRPEAADPQALLAALRERPLAPPPGAPPQVADMAGFVSSLAVSAALGAPMLIDG